MIAYFQVEDKIGRLRFFSEIFLVINIKLEIIQRLLFLKLSYIDISFGEKTLIWKIYITNKTLSITKQVQILDKKNFIIVVLDSVNKMFIVYMVIQK